MSIKRKEGGEGHPIRDSLVKIPCSFKYGGPHCFTSAINCGQTLGSIYGEIMSLY